MILRTLGRLIVVGFGFLLGGAGSAFVLVTLGLERITQAMHPAQPDDWISAVLELAHHGLGLAAGLTVIPALAAVIVGEVARIRSPWYYIVTGGLALAAIPLAARFGATGQDPALTKAIVWQVFATSGFAGGLVYWLVAGRNS